jgi:cation-transporting ATPase I
MSTLAKRVAKLRQLFLGERERAVSIVGVRAYVEYRAIALAEQPAFERLLAASAAASGHGVSVALNPFTRRVIVRFENDPWSREQLLALVEGAERVLAGAVVSAGSQAAPTAEGAGPAESVSAAKARVRAQTILFERALPDDLQLDRELSLEAIADAMALLAGLSFRLVPFVPRRLGTNLYGLLFAISQIERLRRPFDERLGRQRADFLLHIAMAGAQGLSQRPLSSLVDLSEKLVSLRELRERKALWERWSPALTAHDEGVPLATLPEPRPLDVPKGALERYTDRAWMIALGTFGLSAVTTRSPSRAIAAGFAALPVPARLGRELFTAELGRVFAKHHMLVLSPTALRRLDRVDCLVVTADLVSRQKFFVGDVFALRGLSRAQALAEARQLFAADRPLRVQSGENFTLGPAHLLARSDDAELEVEMAERAQRGALVLALTQHDRVVGLVEVQIAPEAGIGESLAAARKLGMQIVLASDDMSVAESMHPDDVIGLQRGLVEGIRRLQGEGRTVCFVGRGPSRAYAAADFGVALCERSRQTPWGAHLLCPDDPGVVATVVEACSVARGVSLQSVRLAMGAAAVGTLASAGGRTPLAARRVLFVVNVASLAAMLNAVRRTAHVDGSTRKPVDPTPWHALDARGVLTRLGSSDQGLPEPKTVRSRDRVRDFSGWIELGRAVQKELMSPLSPLLAVGAGISAVVGSKADAGIVAGVGGLNALIGGYQRFKTERAISSLVEHAETRVHVRRAGRVRVCPASELRRGDLVIFHQGDTVPADCRILEAHSLEVDASALTGESLPVLKSAAPSFAESVADTSSMLWGGTTIAAGRATAVVVATGDDTVMRRGALVTPDEARGGVEARLRALMRLTGPVAMTAGAALVGTGLLRGRRVDDLVSTGVGLAVAAVPEGLPVLATVSQLAAAERLSRRGALVKNPRAIEALGRVDVLCLDKTGTLTEGRIELASVHDGERLEAVSQLTGARRDVLRMVALSVAHDRGLSVDPMDAEIVRAARLALSAEFDRGFVRLAEHAFESGRGFEAVLGRGEEGLRIFVKGAPEQLLARASAVALSGDLLPIARGRQIFFQQLERLTADGLRVIALGERVVSEAELEGSSPRALLDDPRDLIVRGLVAFRDPVRPSAQPAIEGLARAGVRVVMITGDHPNTAHSIAREVGLVKNLGILHGAQISHMTEAQLERAAAKTAVFARVTPAQKVRVVRALQRSGHVVGMVGDGANDAPAMRVADAGIAVGANSTEAARAAADIVLADARIDSLVDAVVEGRAMWNAVRDAVSILVGGNLGEIAFTVAIGALLGRAPLNPRQLLLVNFLTDIAPSMAIALRPPSVSDLSALRDAGPDASLGAPLDREIIARAITTSFGAGSAWTLARLSGGQARARTVGLVGLVGTQLGQTLLKGGHSRSVLWTSLGSFAALGIIIQTPGLSQLFGCTPLGPIAWTTGLSTSMFATALSPVVDTAVLKVSDLVQAVRERLDPSEPKPAVESTPDLPDNVVLLSDHASRLLRN